MSFGKYISRLNDATWKWRIDKINTYEVKMYIRCRKISNNVK